MFFLLFFFGGGGVAFLMSLLSVPLVPWLLYLNDCLSPLVFPFCPSSLVSLFVYLLSLFQACMSFSGLILSSCLILISCVHSALCLVRLVLAVLPPVFLVLCHVLFLCLLCLSLCLCFVARGVVSDYLDLTCCLLYLLRSSAIKLFLTFTSCLLRYALRENI